MIEKVIRIASSDLYLVCQIMISKINTHFEYGSIIMTSDSLVLSFVNFLYISVC